MKTALIIAKDWKKDFNVGNFRIRRYIKWFNALGFQVQLVFYDNNNAHYEHSWGHSISVNSKMIGIIEFLQKRNKSFFIKVIHILFKNPINFFCIPDIGILWGRNVVQYFQTEFSKKKIDIIFSTSPLESSHVIALKLNNIFSAKLITDFRDGWLDEPLKSSIRMSPIHKMIEKSIEEKVVKSAALVILSSDKWKEMMLKRYKGSIDRSKFVVITNAYPNIDILNDSSKPKCSSKINLVYAGNFSRSRNSNKLINLLIVFDKLVSNKIKIEICFYSAFSTIEKIIYKVYKKKLNKKNIILKKYSKLSREKLFERYKDSDGTILLAKSFGTLPVKTFEYLMIKKPTLVITLQRFSCLENCRKYSSDVFSG